MALTARDAMTSKRDCVRASDDVLNAARRLVAMGASALPVVEDDGNPLFTIVNADIVRAVASGVSLDAVKVAELGGLKRRRSVVSVPPVGASDPIEDVLEAMKLHRSDHLGVVEQGQLVGVVSRLHVEALCYQAPDGLPLPPRELIRLVGGSANPIQVHQTFYKRGAQSAETVRTTLERNGIRFGDQKTMLDFGCGCGRVIRHWHGLEGVRVCGTDYNHSLVEWCSANLPFAEFEVNGLEPDLDYPDGTFDLVYAFSVFTHLDAELQRSWISELRRVVGRGGLLLLTLHGPTRLEAMEPGEREAFLAGKLVVREADSAGANACAAFHPESYVRGELGKGLELVDFAVGGAPEIKQDVVLFRNPD